MEKRPPHQTKELEQVLRAAERQGWRVVRAKKFKMYCPCPDKHIKTVALTPSNPHYIRELLKQLRRGTCWKD